MSSGLSGSPPDRRLIVHSGPSGVGKGSICQKLFDVHPDVFAFSVSHTTRMPRVGEVEVVSYFFRLTSTFSSLVSQDAFIEYTFFSGNYYGTSKQTIADQTAKGSIFVLDVEMEGVKRIKSSGIGARYVFVKPPSFDTLEVWLRNRSTEKEEGIQKRLARAKLELEFADTPGVLDLIIVNDDLEKAVRELEEFMFGQQSKHGEPNY